MGGGGGLNSEKIAEKADKNGTFSDLKIEEKTLKKEQKRGKIIALILSIIFLFTALVGGSVFLIVNHINKTTATTESATLTTNLFNTNGTINKSGVQALLNIVGTDTGTYTAHEIASDGKSVIFPMGYYVDASGTMDTSKTLYWQATYKRGGYLTIWLTQPYTCAYYNNNGTTSNAFDPGTDHSGSSSSSYYANYSMSQLRDTTKNIYNLLKAKHTGLDSIIVAPSTSAISAWQSAQDDVYTAYSSSSYAHHNGLGTYSGSYSWGSGTGTAWSSCLSDKMWIPSAYEIFNTTTGKDNGSDTNGLWGLTATDNAYTNTRIDTGASSSSSSTGYSKYCWLRSGFSSSYAYALLVLSSGSANLDGVTGSRGVRPACHISLNVLADIASGAYITTNLFNTDGTINNISAQAVLDAVGYTANPTDTGTYTAHNISTRGTDNSGRTITFPMGYVNGTSGDSLWWRATYLHNNYLTIWLDKAYTESVWTDSSENVSYDSYATSTIQSYIDDTLYPLIVQSNAKLKSIFATPETAGYQILKSGTTSDTEYYRNGMTESRFDNMATTVGNNSFMWLPSFGEVYNNTSNSVTNDDSNYIGQWGLNNLDRAFNTTSYSNSSIDTCLLRSGLIDVELGESNSVVSMAISDTGQSIGMSSMLDGGVRPAAHISLNALEGFLSRTISVTSNNSSYGSVSGGGEYENGATATLIATPNAGYQLKGWSIDGGNTIISTSNPYTITVTQNATYTAVFEIKTYSISVVANDANLGTIFNTSAQYIHGNTYTFVATAFAGCAFLYWIDSSDPNTRIYANPLTVTITSDKTYTAYFTDSLLNGVSVVAEAGGEARINGYTDSDTTIHFSAVAYKGYTFDGWYIYGETTPLSTDWSVDLEKSAINNKLIVAKFSKISANVNTETSNTDKLT